VANVERNNKIAGIFAPSFGGEKRTLLARSRWEEEGFLALT
jgi:hypothetical protein